MPTRKTKRGPERTALNADADVLVCGASFAGLSVARELAGSGARVLVVDRYEIGERQTSACAAPTEWLRRMGLDADPTVIFALRRLGRWDGSIHHDDLRVDSPYNTYRYAGLPPGPICSSGLPSLQAAARPAEVPYLYFVSRNDGTHVFASTLEEQNRNVEIWQRRYWRERRQQERRDRAGAGR